MAQSLQRPLYLASLTPFIFSSSVVSAPLQRRCFSQVAPRLAINQQAQAMRPAQPPERSIRLASREMQQMPSDIGMLEGTFITPPWSQQPSLFRNPRGLFEFQWRRLRTRIQDNVSNLVLKFSSPKVKSWYRRTIKLNRGKLASTATTLHRTMYTAFAQGDSQALRKICTDGLYDSFQARILSRSKGETTEWALVKYNKRAKLMSNRGAILPSSFGVGEGTAFRQAVVRIASKQRLTRFKQDGSVVPGTGKEKDVVEYIVIQQQISQWKQGSWKVWGTTEPTRFRNVET